MHRNMPLGNLAYIKIFIINTLILFRQDSEKVIRHVLDTHTRAQLGQFYDMHSDAFIVGNELNDQMASNNVANGVNFKWKEVQSSKSKFGGTDYFELLGVNVQQKVCFYLHHI